MSPKLGTSSSMFGISKLISTHIFYYKVETREFNSISKLMTLIADEKQKAWNPASSQARQVKNGLQHLLAGCVTALFMVVMSRRP